MNAPHRRWTLWIAALLLCLLFGVNVYRAETQSITVDEAFTYTRFVVPPFAAMRTFYDAGNHVLNTLLAKLSVSLFGVSELALRLPSLLGGLLYFAGLLLVSRRLFGQGGWFLLAIALGSLNPFLLDYLSAARGYGLALALWIWALYLLLRSAHAPPPRNLALAGALMGLSVTANLVYVVPCTALAVSFLLILTAADWRSFGALSAFKQMTWRAAIQFLPAACIAVPILWVPLQAAGREHFFYGAPTSKEAIYTLAEGSLFHDPTFLNVNVAIDHFFHKAPYWFVLAGLLILLATTAFDVLAWLRARTRSEPALGRNLIAGTLIGSVVLLVVLRKGFGVFYHTGRTGLYFAPLLSLACLCVLARVDGSNVFRRVLVAIGVFPLLVLLVQFSLQFNTSYYVDVRFDAGTKRIVERLNQMRLSRSEQRLRVGVTPFFLNSFNFYRQAYRHEWLEPAGFDGSTCFFDYYVVLPGERDSFFKKYRLTEDYYDVVSGATLAKFAPAAFPELNALSAFGFRGPVPCNADFNRLGPVVDTTQPGVEAQFLRDVLSARGPGLSLWLADRPALLFRLPDAAHRVLVMDFLLHSTVLKSVGPQTLTIRINGEVLDRLTYSTEGRRTYRKPVSAGWLRRAAITLLEIEPDKCYVAPADGQKLSFLLRRAEFARQ
jgi:uncharacterized membrane protein